MSKLVCPIEIAAKSNMSRQQMSATNMSRQRPLPPRQPWLALRPWERPNVSPWRLSTLRPSASPLSSLSTLDLGRLTEVCRPNLLQSSAAPKQSPQNENANRSLPALLSVPQLPENHVGREPRPQLT